MTRQFAIIRRAAELRDEPFASCALLPERQKKVEFAVAGLPLQNHLEEARQIAQMTPAFALASPIALALGFIDIGRALIVNAANVVP